MNIPRIERQSWQLHRHAHFHKHAYAKRMANFQQTIKALEPAPKLSWWTRFTTWLKGVL